MYARKSGFCHKKVKEGSKKAFTERAKVCKTALQVGKSRKNHKKHALYALDLRTKHLTRINTKSHSSEDRVTYIHIERGKVFVSLYGE